MVKWGPVESRRFVVGEIDPSCILDERPEPKTGPELGDDPTRRKVEGRRYLSNPLQYAT